jgi:hypothetical protein
MTDAPDVAMSSRPLAPGVVQRATGGRASRARDVEAGAAESGATSDAATGAARTQPSEALRPRPYRTLLPARPADDGSLARVLPFVLVAALGALLFGARVLCWLALAALRC